MKNYPKSVSKECTENILNQMDNIIYKMENHNEKLGTGFFCKLNYNNNIFPVLITSYQIINEKYIHNNNSIEVSLNENKISVEFGLTKYMNKKYNLSVIEIIQDKNEKINFIEIDKNIYEKDAEDLLNKNSIYIIHCKEEKNKLDKFVSYGVIDCMNDIKLKLLCNMISNLNGYSFPIFNLSNNKLIGIYNNDDKFKNDGIFMKYIIKEFLEEYKYKKYYLEYNNRSFINEINILINAEKEDINKEIYFLNGESEEKQDSKYINENIKQLNDMNTELYINNKKENYKKFFKPEREGEYNINIKFNTYLTDCSYMFAGCEKIIKIKFVSLCTKYVTSMKYMFYKCKNLKNIYNLFSFNTTNVTYMDYMFYECQKLNSLDLSSFNTKNVTDMSYMFYECQKLKSLDLSSFVIQDETKMDNIFINCWKLNLNNLIVSYDINKKIKTSKNLLSNNENNLFSMNNENFENEISILIEVDKEDLNKKIYFLDNSENHNYYVDLITSDTKLYINKKREKYKFPQLGSLKRKNSLIPFTKIKSPFSNQSREMFLFKKIFYFFSEKKKKYTKDIKLINNKLNLEYAENEEQFDKRLIKHNFNLLKKGEKIKHFSGPTFSEIKLNELQNKVKFIKSVTDYSYPDMVLFKVQQSEKMLKIKNKNYKILEPFKQKDLQNQIQQKYLKDYLNDAIVIQKV